MPESADSTPPRLVGGLFCGLLAGLLMSGAIQVGISYNYPDEARGPDSSWGLFFWGEHWFLRGITSLIATAWGGFIAGIVARRKGGWVAGLATSPVVVLWGLLAVITGKGEITLFGQLNKIEASASNSILATLLTLAIPICAYIAGEIGAPIGQSVGRHFDSRHGTLLGVEWFHYFWIPFVLHVIVVQTAWVLVYASGWLLLNWAAGPGLSFTGIASGIFILAIYGTLWLTFSGISRAYAVLAGFETRNANHGMAVLKFGCGWPFLAGLLQGGITVLHYGLLKLLKLFQ